MTLRVRLTLIYSGLFAGLFIVMAFGGQMLLQGHFEDRDRIQITLAAEQFRGETSIRVARGTFTVNWPSEAQLKPLANRGIYFQVITGDVHVTYRSTNLGTDRIQTPPKVVSSLPLQSSQYAVAYLRRQSLASVYIPLVMSGRHYGTLIVARSNADVARSVNHFRLQLFGGLAILLLIVIGLTWLVSRSAVQPIRTLTERAAAIADAKDFSGRVSVRRSVAELRTLASTFNRMVSSLQEAYAHQQRFVADASHELRTPLTVVQANLHFLESNPSADAEDLSDALHTARVEADRMTLLVNQLLALSRADSGQAILRETVELDRVLVDAFRRIQSRERNQLTGREKVFLRLGRLDEFVVIGDPYLLLELVLILLDNAVKYTPDGGEVTVNLIMRSQQSAAIQVADSGVGIAPEDRERVFERFFRAQRSRQMGEGSGLGLPIAKWITEAHGGRIDFADGPSGGTVFSVILPGQPSSPGVSRIANRAV